MSKSALSIAATKRIIDVSWWAMLRLCEGTFHREIHDLVDMEESAERQHRSSRQRFPISCNYAARLFVLQHILTAPQGTVKWSDVGSYAPRVVAAYALGARLHEVKIYPAHKAIFEGETFGPRLLSVITQAIAAEMSDDDYKLLHARRGPDGIADHLPLVCAVDYVRDIVRGK